MPVPEPTSGGGRAGRIGRRRLDLGALAACAAVLLESPIDSPKLASKQRRCIVDVLRPARSERTGKIATPHKPHQRISVIIPVLNEAGQVRCAIESARTLGECEIVVVDGGSTDATLQEAEQADRVLVTEAGRALQQNRGAAASRGDVLLFLHADCRLEQGGFAAVEEALKDESCVGGCFRQYIDASGLPFRILERGNALRVRLWKWAYGDQGIFVRRDAFERVGGFPEIALMEDLYFLKRIKRTGRFKLTEGIVRVSARRWQRRGVVRQTLQNWGFLVLAHLGVSPNRLARFYREVR